MANVKVAAIRKTLDAFAELYDHAGACNNAVALRKLSVALCKADKRTVDELVNILSTGGQPPSVPPIVSTGH